MLGFIVRIKVYGQCLGLVRFRVSIRVRVLSYV